ncbi:hypothetical protein SAMN04244553_3592 [Nocardia amikacinitolerans]|uniref:Head-to-tail stopper n=1 Tax=Nocardia amikacinitolerans TaxID=756689 RepID=A0A285LK53_9NOCA|nr:hypothetical protein [Nocardia amikacinitolerans]SNY84056.1 hypothetical protein SAMN04244553_3592 [Nocardia amikacinitolerans]
MSFLPTPWTVRYHERTPGGPDPHRNPAIYTPPADQPGTEVPVYGWYTPAIDDPFVAGHPDRVNIDVVLLAPPDFAPTDGSLIDLPAGPAGRFEVSGGVRDYNYGPFGFQPGGLVALRKAVG